MLLPSSCSTTHRCLFECQKSALHLWHGSGGLGEQLAHPKAPVESLVLYAPVLQRLKQLQASVPIQLMSALYVYV